MSSKDATEEIVLRDLQSLLRKSLDEQLQVLDYTSIPLLPKGENYSSLILKIDAVIKRAKNAPQEQLALIAKMMPPTEFQQNMLDLTASLNKEVFVFDKLFEAYRQVEREAGMKPDELIDLVPKFYGGRLSLDEKSDKADKDAALLLENLKASGYDNMNRFKGLDLTAAKVAISELARYHALGIAVKHKKPDFFAEARKVCDIIPFELKDNKFEEATEHMIKAICVDPRIAKFEDRVRASIQRQNWDAFFFMEAVEPWVTMIHGDFWVNNMMFRQKNGKIDGVKFVDFQIARATSPLKDLPYFLCGSTSMEVVDHHFDELIDVYYENFIKVLKRLNCDVTPFSREHFDKQLMKDGRDELFHCLIALKFFTLEVSDDLDLNDMMGSVMLSSGNNLYLERSWKVVSKFAEKGWI